MPDPVFGQPPDISMSGDNDGVFDGSILGIWPFNSSLDELVANNDLSAVSGPAVYKAVQRYNLLTGETVGRGVLLFEEDRSFSVSPTYSYDEDFTVTFWWYSPQPVGYTRNVVTRELQTKIAPIVAKSDFSVSASKTILQNPSFVITEVAASKTKNAIRAQFSNNNSTITHSITSESYEPGLRHVMVTYLSSENLIRVDIDGKVGTTHLGPTSSIASSGDIWINSIVPGPLAYRTIQTDGYLFDLVMTTFAANENEALKMMRYGYEYITVVGLFGARFQYFPTSYTQPTTISTNQILVEGGNIYSSRSNGEILKGTRPFWDKEFSYTSPQEVSLLSISETDPTDSEEPADGSKRIAEWTTSGLKLKGTRVKI